jgi:hypothetical protein
VTVIKATIGRDGKIGAMGQEAVRPIGVTVGRSVVPRVRREVTPLEERRLPPARVEADQVESAGSFPEIAGRGRPAEETIAAAPGVKAATAVIAVRVFSTVVRVGTDKVVTVDVADRIEARMTVRTTR